jgi:hypothetical protein
MTDSTGRDPETYTVHEPPLRTLDTLPRVGIWDLARDHGRFYKPNGRRSPLWGLGKRFLIGVPLDDLIRAVLEDRLTQLTDQGRAQLATHAAEDALFDFLRTIVLRWGATDRGLAQALAGMGIDVSTLLPDAEAAFIGVLGDLLRAAQQAGAVRGNIDVSQVKALMVGCQAIQAYRPDLAAGVIDIALDGLRP